MLKRLAFLRPSRLFWKLFAAFMLATGASFLIGIGFISIADTTSGPVIPQADTAARIAQLIQSRGIGAARPLLDGQYPDGSIEAISGDGHWVAGAQGLPEDAARIRVTDPRGHNYTIVIEPRTPQINRTTPLVVGTLVSLFFSVAVAWYLARPLTHLSRGFRAVAAGQLSTRVTPLVGSRRDEIADLTREFDGMATQLQQLVNSQQRLLHDISHELRSPLARLQVAIGLLRQTPENLPIMLARVEREADRLNHLIEELLTLARLKSGAPDEETANLDMIDLLEAIVDDASFEARAKNCDVRFDRSEGFVTHAHGELLYRAFENVIRNAVKFSPPGSLITIETHPLPNGLAVRVIDDGPGVPPDLRERMFEPFNRINEANAAGAVPTGFGLGLAIARFAIERHGGTIRAQGRDQGPGLVIEVNLPRHPVP